MEIMNLILSIYFKAGFSHFGNLIEIMQRNCQYYYFYNNLKNFLLIILLIIISSLLQQTQASRSRTINLNMPNVRPNHDESYLCKAQRLDPGDHEFIVGFEPNASATKVHHILIYGCGQPGKFVRDTPSYVWECGEMNLMGPSSGQAISPYDNGPVCANGALTKILFGWALDAPSIELPPEVGFKIGGESGINFLVLQVHYGNTELFRNNSEITDNSGIFLHTKSGPNTGIKKLAGIYLLVSYGYVQEGLSRHEMQCLIDEDKVIHPFRFRTHTHKLGLKVGAYKLPKEKPTKAILIGEHDPQKPQMFYPIKDKGMTISKGDQIYAYCDYNNTRARTVYIGATGNDEMCNFYMMYWTEGNSLLKNQDCLKYNPH